MLVGLYLDEVGQLGVLPYPDLLAKLVSSVVVIAEPGTAVEDQVLTTPALLFPDRSAA